MILRIVKRTEQQAFIDEALRACIKKKLFSAIDFVDMVRYIERKRQVYVTVKRLKVPIKPLNVQNESILLITTQQRDIDEYLTVLEGEK